MRNFILFSGIGELQFNFNTLKVLMAKIEELPDVGGLGDSVFRISSKDVAEATGKRHDAVLRDIRNLLSQGVHAHNFVFTFIIKELPNGAKRRDPVYMLTKKGVLLLTSGYSAKLREAVINRWEELERQCIAEERDPSLSINKAISAWERQGKSPEWIQTRTQGIVQRHVFTDTLKAHGVEGSGYGLCTNAIYKPILGGTKKEVSAKRNLPQKANLRDNLCGVELAAVTLSEALATERIENNNSKGNLQCAKQSMIAATNVSEAIAASRKQ